MPLKRFLKRVVEKVAVKYGLEVVRGFVLKRLEPVTVDDLYKAVKDGTHTWSVAEEGDRKRGKKWARKFRKHRDKLQHKNVLLWLSEDRPDLASLLINLPEEGIEWLKEDVEIMKKQLF